MSVRDRGKRSTPPYPWAVIKDIFERSAELRQHTKEHIESKLQPLPAGFYLVYFAFEYANKLGKGPWGLPTQIAEDGDWAEAERQAKLIYRRLTEIAENKSLDAMRERVFLKKYARVLLVLYKDRGRQIPGLPLELIRILIDEYPGDAAAIKMLAFEEKKVGNKGIAVAMVKLSSDIPQSDLARFAKVTQRTIRNWTPDLLAAGWKGTGLDRKAAAKSEKPVKPGLSDPGVATLKWMEGKGPEDD